MNDKVVILPWLGEFGWLIMRHARFVQWHPAPQKVVCCEAGHECLFPSASEYFTDWENPIPEAERWEGTRWQDPGARDRYYKRLASVLRDRFPEHEIVAPTYSCHWHMSDAPGFTYRPIVDHYLPYADVVLAPRARSFDVTRNWAHWSRLATALRSLGLTVGIAGRRETTRDVIADAYAWGHPQGDTAGTIDLLTNCDLYVGVDSGISHLAALLDTPTLLIRSPNQPSDQFGILKRANKGWINVLPADAWADFRAVEESVLRAIQQARLYSHYDLAVYGTVDAATAEWQSWAESLFDRIGEESQASGRRIVTRLRVLNADDQAIQTAHRYRNRVHEIDCVRAGQRPVAPLARPHEADRIIYTDGSHDPNTLAL